MKVANLILCILNVLCLVFNLYTQNYTVAFINGVAIMLTANVVLNF